MLIEQKIQELLEKRDICVSSSDTRVTAGIEDNTQKALTLNVSEIREVMELSSRVRNSINFIRSFWDIQLIDEIFDFFVSLCAENPEYQEIFLEYETLNDPFDSYDSKCKVLLKGASFLRDNNRLSDIKNVIIFLKHLDKKDYEPLSDEALRRKLSI